MRSPEGSLVPGTEPCMLTARITHGSATEGAQDLTSRRKYRWSYYADEPPAGSSRSLWDIKRMARCSLPLGLNPELEAHPSTHDFCTLRRVTRRHAG